MELRIFTEPQQGATYDDLLAVARTAEECGFGAFFRSDHYVAMNSAGLPGPTDAWITLAGLARDTGTIRLGTLVTSATFRYPGPLAISVAQVDAMSGGRVELGIGAGWFAGDAFTQAGGHDLEPRAVKGTGNGRQLRHHVLALAPLFDHRDHTGELTLRSAQPVEHRVDGFLVADHGFSSRCPSQ